MKKADAMVRVRFRVDFGDQCAVGHGKVQLLEQIEQTGSLSQAARAMGMSYRRAWLLLDNLNHSFDVPVAHTLAGGKGGGGAELTAFGHELIDAFRRFEQHLQTAARQQLQMLQAHAITSKSGKTAKVRAANSVAPKSMATRRAAAN